MLILKTIGKYCGQYIISYILISLFVPNEIKSTAYTIVGTLIAVSLFASTLSLVLGRDNISSSIST